jgi:protein ImuB
MGALWLAIRLPTLSASEIEALACWSGRFTPRISLAAGALLLEVSACLRLFGGLAALRQQLLQGLAEQEIAVAGIAVADTPQAALWLVEAGGEDLDALPISAISWPIGVAEKLGRFGLRHLGDVRRLPSAALARRIGREATILLARAYGETADPRVDFVFPLRFELRIELPAPTDSAPALFFAARRLTAALAGWLSVRQAGVRACRLDLLHRQGKTELPLHFAAATRTGDRLECVLHERLQRLQLAAPVEILCLAAEEVETLAAVSTGLFDDGPAREGMAALIERLRARLGEERIFGLGCVADHRPECATQVRFPGQTAVVAGHARPLWLLAIPEAMGEVGGRPYRRGSLQLLAGPERIESGWWQAGEMSAAGVGDCRRDYFIAKTADARWAWIFRELRPPGGWFLHGWFA